MKHFDTEKAKNGKLTGFGALKRAWIDKRIVLICKAGDQFAVINVRRWKHDDKVWKLVGKILGKIFENGKNKT